MKNFTLSVFFIALSFASAQAQRVGHLTVFSEDGDAFTLVLNGETINDTPQTNLRVEDLPQPYYSARIIFEDKTKNDVTTNNLSLQDVDGIFQDVTYKIKRDKNNSKKMKMNFFSSTEVVPNFIPPAKTVVVHYGQPRPVSNTVVTQTTTTTTAQPTGGISMGASMPGMNVNISIQDPEMSGSVTHTTTTTTTYSGHEDVEMVEEPAGCHRGRAMTSGNFTSALESLRKQKFEDSRLKTAKQICRDNCLSAAQIASVCKEFSFEDNKLDFAKCAYASCTEPQNYFKVTEVFTFSTSVDELNAFIAQ